MKKKWVTVAAAAVATGKSDRTIRRWVSMSKIPHKRDGRRLFIDISGLDLPHDIDTDLDMSMTNVYDNMVIIARLEAEAEGLRALVARLETELNDWKGQAYALTANQQKLIEAEAAPDRGRPWWAFWRKD